MASDNMVTVNGITYRAITLRELSDKQKKEYKLDALEYQLMDKFTNEILDGKRKVRYAVKMSARQYLPAHETVLSARQMIGTLADRYKLSDDEIALQSNDAAAAAVDVVVETSNDEASTVDGTHRA